MAYRLLLLTSFLNTSLLGAGFTSCPAFLQTFIKLLPERAELLEFEQRLAFEELARLQSELPHAERRTIKKNQLLQSSERKDRELLSAYLKNLSEASSAGRWIPVLKEGGQELRDIARLLVTTHSALEYSPILRNTKSEPSEIDFHRNLYQFDQLVEREMADSSPENSLKWIALVAKVQMNRTVLNAILSKASRNRISDDLKTLAEVKSERNSGAVQNFFSALVSGRWSQLFSSNKLGEVKIIKIVYRNESNEPKMIILVQSDYF